MGKACVFNIPIIKLMRSLKGKCCTVLLVCCALNSVNGPPASPQSGQQPVPLPTIPRPARVPFGSDDDSSTDPSIRHAEQQAAKRRNLDRQKQMVADTNKLLQLAQELKQEVDKKDKDALSLATAKKAEEIEKLARSVRDKMKAQ